MRTGGAVSDPTAWRKGAVSVNAVAAFLASVLGFATAAGYDLSWVDPTTVATLAGGILALSNILLHVATDARLGLSAGRVAADAPDPAGYGSRQPADSDTPQPP